MSAAKLPALDEATKAALREVVSREPFRWRLRIGKIWARGGADAVGSDAETVRALYRLRNTHGPGWLKRVKPESFAAAAVSRSTCVRCLDEASLNEGRAPAVCGDCVPPRGGA